MVHQRRQLPIRTHHRSPNTVECTDDDSSPEHLVSLLIPSVIGGRDDGNLLAVQLSDNNHDLMQASSKSVIQVLSYN